ncbi:hypothetical protein R0381_003244 [Jeongeupia wiesaeckerbachi]|uniref:hypothetical protein n=1 Tax=Jeongeupia wiesaeckerbachi TaxID=3051218 RepID=UPI003D8083B1
MPSAEAHFDTCQTPAAWRLFDQNHPPCAATSLIYLLEDSAGRLLLNDGEPLYPGGLYIGPQTLAPRTEPGSSIQGIQISTTATAVQRLCKTQIPVVIAPGSRTRLLAGQIDTCDSPLPWPGALIDLRLDTGFPWTSPCKQTARVIVIAGELHCGDTPMPAGGEYALSASATLHAGQRSHALIWLAPPTSGN